jgi:hypothetical protein
MAGSGQGPGFEIDGEQSQERAMAFEFLWAGLTLEGSEKEVLRSLIYIMFCRALVRQGMGKKDELGGRVNGVIRRNFKRNNAPGPWVSGEDSPGLGVEVKVLG